MDVARILRPAGVGLCLMLVACAGGGHRSARTRSSPATRCGVPPGSRIAVAPRTDPAVTLLDLTVTDHRPTGCRVLPTEVRLPPGAGAGPLVVVAHGLDGSPASLAPLLDSWARAGFVVAAPTLPVTAKDPSGNSLRSESVDQAYDLRAVVDAVTSPPRSGGDPLLGRVDPTRIGAAGMSLGGLAVYALISNSCCRDARIDAAIVMAGVRRDFPDERYGRNHAPVMLLQGDGDPGYHNSVDAYPELGPPKWFVTLHGARHAPPFEVPTGPEAPLVRQVTRDFWARYLRDDRPAARRIVAAVAAPGSGATLRYDAG